ncbi:MAG: hypothetical protein IPK33_22150 [Gemmatimonadetes bacterium]|nr:hypothetical protein [Gemmatimonadota bacterium]
MEERERRAERMGCGSNGADDSEGGGLSETRSSGQDFLAAGDEAIRRALSGDSARFLNANRQRGGQ